MKKKIYILPVIAALLTIACGKTDSYVDEDGVFFSSEAVYFEDTARTSFENLNIKDTARKEFITQLTSQFYKRNDFKSRWLYLEEPTKLLTNFLDELKRAKYYGLDPENYNYSEISNAVKNFYDNKESTEQLEDLDKEITASFLLFMTHLNAGQVRPVSYGKKIWRSEEKLDYNELNILLAINDDKELEEVLDTIQPKQAFYHQLRKELRKVYADENRDIKEFTFENANAFKVGYSNEKVGMIRHNLNQWGITVSNDSNANVVDSSLIKALKTFQKSRSIAEDGLPGENTLLYLNMNKKQLIDLISLNLERMRWLPKNMGENYILVNVPEFIMRVYDEEEVKVKMKVIVGKQFNPTPIFSDTLKYIVFRPTWTVPQSIIQNEMLPKLKENPNYYTNKGFKVYQGDEEINPRSVNWNNADDKYYRFVQQPSSSNALGLVKFIFPNDLSIYLHDTPTDYLFDNEERALSHGCVRVQYPAELATYLLKDVDGWDEEKVKNAIEEGDTKTVYMKTLYHVQIAYLTTWVDEDGKLIIAEDIYGHDKRQLESLKKKG